MTKTMASYAFRTPPRVAHAKPPGPKKYCFLHMSSSYAKTLGQKLFRTREIHQSGSKVKDGGKKRRRKKRRERLNEGNNNGHLRIATPPRVPYAKPPGPK